MRFSNNIKRLNDLCAHPRIKPYISPGIEVNFHEIEPNVLLECEKGFFFFITLGTTYEVHTIGPPGIGKYTIEAMRKIFTETDCLEIRTRVPVSNEPAARLSEKSGMRYLHTTKKSFIGEDCYHYSITIDEWPMVDDECLRMGDKFHDIAPNTHEDCETHDRYVGASLMIAENKPLKSAAFYNKWALLTGYMPVRIESLDPLIIDNYEFKIRLKPLEVICQ